MFVYNFSVKFKIESKFKPAGDQPKAIKQLVNGLEKNQQNQVLLGATGTGKTFTIANVISKVQRPCIVLSHNKTLAAQLFAELKSMFPNNKVEYFVSNFDYYRPEAYIPSSDTYIDKTSKSNWDLESMRMSALNSLSTRQDTIVVASVAAIYGSLSPEEYKESFLQIEVNQKINRREFFIDLVKRNYSRNEVNLNNGQFRAKGDIIEICPSWTQDYHIRIDTFGDLIEDIALVDTLSKEIIKKRKKILIFPADAYTTKTQTIKKAIKIIEEELEQRITEFKSENKLLEAQRIEERTRGDIESLKEFGITPGIENYSRYLDGRKAGERPYTILDYLPKNGLIIVDESHMLMPQIQAMFNADRSRKEKLVDYGFRLPSALDNRPLKFEEFEKNFDFPRIFISATPADYELNKTNGVVVSQIIRPTGLLDPEITIEKTSNQIESIFDHIQKQKQKKERTLILTTTKKMAEELTHFLQEKNEKVAYIHSEHKTFQRDEIIRKLRKGVYDTLIGINLMREGMDIPEVSLVLILDADKESFFRSTKSLIQIIGRAARNVNGRVVFYGDILTKSMQEAIAETNRRRKIQEEFNIENNIIPQTIKKPIPSPINAEKNNLDIEKFLKNNSQNKEAKKIFINDLRKQMLRASKKMDFERAAQLRDTILELED